MIVRKVLSIAAVSLCLSALAQPVRYTLQPSEKLVSPAAYGKVFYDSHTGKFYSAIGGYPYIASITTGSGDVVAEVCIDDRMSFAYKKGAFTAMPHKGKARNFFSYKGNRSEGGDRPLLEFDAMEAVARLRNEPFKGIYFDGKLIMDNPYSFCCNQSGTAMAGIGKERDGSFYLKTSKGVSVKLPGEFEQAYISPDGNRAMATNTANNELVIVNDKGQRTSLGKPADNMVWLHNSGNVFSIDTRNSKLLKKNGKPFKQFDKSVNADGLFISADTRSFAWLTDGFVLHFSDGTVFDYVTYACKRQMKGKDHIFFLVNYSDGKMYMCQKEL